MLTRGAMLDRGRVDVSGITCDRVSGPVGFIQLHNENVDSEQKVDRQNANG